MTDLPWWGGVLILGVGGPLLMIASAWLGALLYFVLEPGPRCPGCNDRLPTHYRGRRYTGERCPRCEILTAVKEAGL